MRQRLGRIAAWLLTIGLLGYLFWKIPASQVLEAVHVAAGWTVPALAISAVSIYVCDSLAMWKTFGWFVAPLRFGEVLIVRGATYLLALVNYALGQGGIVYFINKSRGIPVIRGAAAVLLIMGTNVLLLLFLASLGVAAGAGTVPKAKMVLMVGYAGFAAYMAVVIARPAFLTRRPLFDVLLTAGVPGYAKALAVRVPHIFSIVTFSFIALRGFHVEVPFLYALTCLPMVFFFAPFTVQGLGTTQALMVYFFARYASPGGHISPEAAVLAASLAAQVVALLVQAVISVVCLRSQIARDLRQVPTPS